jgi:hypothetical protein
MGWLYTNQGVLTRQLRAPPAGSGYVSVANLPWSANSLSVLEDADPAALAGDVIRWDLATSPSGFAVTMNPDGTFNLDESDDGTQQTFDYRLWRHLSNTWFGPETVTLEGEVIGPAILSGGGSLVGKGYEPLPIGAPGNWEYTEPGVLEDELRLFGGLGRIAGGGVLLGLGLGAERSLGTGLLSGNGILAGLGAKPAGSLRRGTGAISGNGQLAGLGFAVYPRFGTGSISGGGRLYGKGFAFRWQTVVKTDTLWVKVR